MPASEEEIAEALEEDVTIDCGWGPKEILTETLTASSDGCSNMIPSEKKLPYVLGNGAKQALKIKFSKKKEQ